MRERGRINDRAIWLKIFLYEAVIFKASLKMPKKPRNWNSSCSLSIRILLFLLHIELKFLWKLRRNIYR